ncbi:MAG: cupin domain-containing protein [Terracidiphilus sp.]
MITRRDLLVALPAAAVVPGAFALEDQRPVMGSAVFDWDAMPVKPTGVGSTRAVFNARTATLENLEVHVTTLNPGQSPHPPHRHPNEELIILRQGTMEVLSNGELKRVGPGSVVFNGSNQLHGLKNVGVEPAVYHVVNFKTAATPGPLPPDAKPQP